MLNATPVKNLFRRVLPSSCRDRWAAGAIVLVLLAMGGGEMWWMLQQPTVVIVADDGTVRVTGELVAAWQVEPWRDGTLPALLAKAEKLDSYPSREGEGLGRPLRMDLYADRRTGLVVRTVTGPDGASKVEYLILSVGVEHVPNGKFQGVLVLRGRSFAFTKATPPRYADFLPVQRTDDQADEHKEWLSFLNIGSDMLTQVTVNFTAQRTVKDVWIRL